MLRENMSKRKEHRKRGKGENGQTVCATGCLSATLSHTLTQTLTPDVFGDVLF